LTAVTESSILKLPTTKDTAKLDTNFELKSITKINQPINFMAKKEYTIVNEILDALWQLIPRPFETKYTWANRLKHLNRKSYNNALYKMKKRGVVKEISKDGKKILKLTQKGELEILLAKAKLPRPKKWDKKWRLLVYDIPEDAKEKRHLLRSLLKKNNFYKLQASVFINPYPLNREAITYLQKTGLSAFIRIMKIEEMDNDKDLKIRFNLV